MAPTTLQQALGATQLDIGKLFGVGGSAWTVTDAEGTDRGTVTLYVRRIRQQIPTLTGAGFATDTRWVGVGPLASLAADADSNGLLRGRMIESVADPSLRFYVPDTIDTLRGIVHAPLEPNT